MGLNNRLTALRRFAFARPRAFPVLGWGGRGLWADVLRRDCFETVLSPRNADVLVLCGEIPLCWSKLLVGVFETLALPRTVLWLSPHRPCEPPPGLPIGRCCGQKGLDENDILALRATLLDGDSAANQAQLPDRPHIPWHGHGDHGQGGEGMMGGVPYGRPMAMTHDDPDGLALDDVPTLLGPFFPGLPSGLQLTLHMQGDRIRACDEPVNCFPAMSLGGTDRHRLEAGTGLPIDALDGTLPTVRAVEQARIDDHLAWMAGFLTLAGLPALAERIRALTPPISAGAIARIAEAAGRSGLARLCRGVGRIDALTALASGMGGPLARASGVVDDARSDDPAYRDLGFTPLIANTGDVWARWQVRVQELLQSLALLQTGGETHTNRVVEGPRGPLRLAGQQVQTPSATLLPLLPELIDGQLWSEAVLTLASLDLDMAEAALVMEASR